ncbi:hypothetical protein OSTOST_19371, partial [Ostertagia ostertagi]
TVYAARAGNNLYGIDVEVDYRGRWIIEERKLLWRISFAFLLDVIIRPHLDQSVRTTRQQLRLHENPIKGFTSRDKRMRRKFNNEKVSEVEYTLLALAMYHEMFLIADTCRSASMYEWVSSPGVLSSSSSLTHEESYSYDVDDEIGVYVIDR